MFFYSHPSKISSIPWLFSFKSLNLGTHHCGLHLGQPIIFNGLSYQLKYGENMWFCAGKEMGFLSKHGSAIKNYYAPTYLLKNSVFYLHCTCKWEHMQICESFRPAQVLT